MTVYNTLPKADVHTDKFFSIYDEIDPKILVDADRDPLLFKEAILPHLPIDYSPNQKFVLKTFYDPAKNYNEMLLCAGRKSGKSVTTSTLVLKEVYHLLNTPNLHQKYHLIPGQPIYIMVTSTSYEQALGVMFKYILSLVEGSWYLADYVVNKTKEEIEFVNNVKIKCQPCSSRSGLGFPVWMNVYDEHAFMLTRSGNAAGDVVWDALQPNLKVFHGDGKTASISSPSGMEGIFWELFSHGVPERVIQKCTTHGEHPWRMVCQFATWEMNPDLPRNHPEIEKEKLADPANFTMQFGAEFSNILEAALQPKSIDDCAIGREIDENIPEKTIRRYIILDPATVGDAYGVIMGHLQDTPKKDTVVTDIIKPFHGTHDNPVDINNVENYIRFLCKNFKVVKIIIDQHQSWDTYQKFKRENLPINTPVNINAKYNMDMYTELFRRINTGHIEYRADPDLLDQLKFLQKKYAGWGWKVEAARGHHDDLSDCLANLCYTISNDLGKAASWAAMSRFYSTSPWLRGLYSPTSWFQTQEDMLYAKWFRRATLHKSRQLRFNKYTQRFELCR